MTNQNELITEDELKHLLYLIEHNTNSDYDVAEALEIYLNNDRDLDHVRESISRGQFCPPMYSYRDHNLRLISAEDWVRLNYMRKK